MDEFVLHSARDSLDDNNSQEALVAITSGSMLNGCDDVDVFFN